VTLLAADHDVFFVPIAIIIKRAVSITIHSARMEIASRITGQLQTIEMTARAVVIE